MVQCVVVELLPQMAICRFYQKSLVDRKKEHFTSETEFLTCRPAVR